MKKLITFLSISTTVAILALPVAARTSIAQPDVVIQECTQETKDALYAEFLKIRNTDQAKAYDDAKKYLACPPGEVTEASQKIVDYLKKWVKAYEDGTKKIRFRELLYKEKKYPEAYALGKEILAAEPDNTMVTVHLGANGYLVANNPSLAAESLEYAKKAIQALDSGKVITDWEELGKQDVAVAYLNFTVGALTLEKDPANALKNLLKAAQFETPLKKSAATYGYIAGAYETGPYAKLSDAYKACCAGKEETPESKLALANINQIVDRMIDGYARAVALAGTDPAYAKQKEQWNDSLTQWYKFRNATDTQLTGLKDLLASILTKPLPPEPTPLTSLPATPASTPASASGTGTGNGTASTSAPATSTTTTPAGSTANKTTTPAAGTKPAPKPDRPRNR
jgi:hypothetical protein